ncbi:hypothetical protein R1flu_000774 [Riccia fluitans]|uniref:Uncharacterized protein n=1 Tax=Riccia fluitans TaxID=41844 RepID=A0ABD1Y5H7_9MARC
MYQKAHGASGQIYGPVQRVSEHQGFCHHMTRAVENSVFLQPAENASPNGSVTHFVRIRADHYGDPSTTHSTVLRHTVTQEGSDSAFGYNCERIDGTLLPPLYFEPSDLTTIMKCEFRGGLREVGATRSSKDSAELRTAALD